MFSHPLVLAVAAVAVLGICGAWRHARRTRPAPRTGARLFAGMTAPAAAAYVVVTVVSLTCRAVALLAGLLAEFADRLADAADLSVVRPTVIVPTAGGSR